MNRRSFLRGSGAALLGVATLGLIGEQAGHLLSCTHNGITVYGHPNGSLLYVDPILEEAALEMAKQAGKTRDAAMFKLLSKTS